MVPEFATVTGIIVICYLIGMAVKTAPFIDDKWIPVIVGLFGAVLGGFGMILIPNFPADNIIDAVAVGIASGLASTGANQVYKQLHQ